MFFLKKVGALEKWEEKELRIRFKFTLVGSCWKMSSISGFLPHVNRLSVLWGSW